MTASAIKQLGALLSSVAWLHVYTSRSGKGFHVLAFPKKLFMQNGYKLSDYSRAFKEAIETAIGQTFKCDIPKIVYFWREESTGFQFLSEAREEPPAIQPSRAAPRSYSSQEAEEISDGHRRILDWLANNQTQGFVETSLGGYAHTCDLKACNQALKLLGNFDTIATGASGNGPNAWMIALTGDRFLVGRFNDVAEPSWERQYIVLNEAQIPSKILQLKGVDGWLGKSDVAKMIEGLGHEVPDNLPESVKIKDEEYNVLLLSDERIEGWAKVGKKWGMSFKKPAPICDDLRIVREAGSDALQGNTRVLRRYQRNEWQPIDVNSARTHLILNRGFGPKTQADRFLVPSQPTEVWKVTREPFQPEFSGENNWNLSKTKFRFEPTPGEHRTFDLIYDHIGQGLNHAVESDPRCLVMGIQTGAQYLRYWTASLIQNPSQLLPPLGLISFQQRAGKSTFAECHEYLFTGSVCGIMPLETNFNGELSTCPLWQMDDCDLSQDRDKHYQKLLPLMTEEQLMITAKNKDSRKERNYLHFIMSSNKVDHVPIREGDERWVMIEVARPKTEIPRPEIRPCLLKEAPHFLHTLWNLDLPNSTDRLYLPPVMTQLKADAIAITKNQLSKVDQQLFCNLRGLADNGFFSRVRTFKEIAKEMYDDENLSAQLSRQVVAVAPRLRAYGYQTEATKNVNGRTPATLSIHRL